MEHRWIVLAISTFSFMSLCIAMFAYPPITKDIAAEWGLSYTKIGLIMSAFSITYGIIQIPAGIISDRFGGSRVASYSVTFLGLTALLFSFSKNYEMAFISRSLMGLSGGFLLPATMKLLPQWFSRREIDKAMGILGTGQGIGVFLALLIVPILVERFGWRVGFNLSTITSLVAAALSWFIIRDLYLSKRGESSTLSIATIKKVVTKKLLLLSSFNLTAAAVYMGVITWSQSFLIDNLHISIVKVGYITAIIGVTMIFGSFASGILPPRIGGNNVIIISMLMCVLLPYIFYYSNSSITAFLIIAMIGWATNFYWGPTWGGIPQVVDKRYIGLAFGVFNTLTSIGVTFSLAISGVVLDYTFRFDLAFLSISLIALVGLIGSVIYERIK